MIWEPDAGESGLMPSPHPASRIVHPVWSRCLFLVVVAAYAKREEFGSRSDERIMSDELHFQMSFVDELVVVLIHRDNSNALVRIQRQEMCVVCYKKICARPDCGTQNRTVSRIT